jgi:hypothetical protein
MIKEVTLDFRNPKFDLESNLLGLATRLISLTEPLRLFWFGFASAALFCSPASVEDLPEDVICRVFQPCLLSLPDFIHTNRQETLVHCA